ncbi:MAG: TOBE domain-containing protein [Phycisphaerales bacterium]
MKAGRIVQVGTPHELYHKPADRFVAEFLGETNFLTGKLSADGTAIATAGGTLRTARPATESIARGGEVAVSLRPEALRLISGGADGENLLRGRVVESTYLGEIAQHAVELAGGGRVKVAQLNPGPVLAMAGSEVSLSVSPSDVVVLPA